jgi:hypothetical protein
MRDKLIGLAVVVVVAGLIVYFAKMRASHVEPPSADGAAVATSTRAIGDAEADAGATDASIAAIVDAAAEDATLQSAACRALAEASKQKYEVARAAGWCINSSVDELGCETSSNGATWGLRVDDVTDLEEDAAACPTGWLVRVVHVAADGGQQALVPPGPGGVRNGHPYNVYKSAPVYVVKFFDWDGDGEDEAVIGRWSSIFVYAFKKGHIVTYAPASRLTVSGVDDFDGDGRPDLLIRPFGDAPPTRLELVAHSLADGTFTLHDVVAVKRAQSLCPTDTPVALGVAEEVLADDVACALIWGQDPKALRKQLCDSDAGPCASWVKGMLATKPPLSLK